MVQLLKIALNNIIDNTIIKEINIINISTYNDLTPKKYYNKSFNLVN